MPWETQGYVSSSEVNSAPHPKGFPRVTQVCRGELGLPLVAAPVICPGITFVSNQQNQESALGSEKNPCTVDRVHCRTNDSTK